MTDLHLILAFDYFNGTRRKQGTPTATVSAQWTRSLNTYTLPCNLDKPLIGANLSFYKMSMQMTQPRHKRTRHESVSYLTLTRAILVESVTKFLPEIVLCRLVTDLVLHPGAPLHIGYVKVKLCDHDDYWHCRHSKSGIGLQNADSSLCYDATRKSLLRLF